MYTNDHISIDNILIDVERKVENVAHLRTSLYEIFEIEDYKKLRRDLSQFLYDYETDVKTVIDALKHIQEVNRKFYDSYAIMKNNEVEMLQRFNCFQKENEMLKERLSDSSRQVQYLGELNVNQENYINDLIDKLRNKEKKEYGCQLTRNPFSMGSELNSPRSFNYDYDNHNEQVPFYRKEIGKGQVPPLKLEKREEEGKDDNRNDCKEKAEDDSEQSEKCDYDNDNHSQGNKKDSKLLTLEQVEELFAKNKMIEKIKQQQKEKKEKEEQDMKNKTEVKKDIRSKDNDRIIPKEHVNNDEETVMITTDNNKASQVKRVQNIIIRSFKSESILSDLKTKFGHDFLDKLTSSNINEDYLLQIESALNNRSIFTNSLSQQDQPQHQFEKPQSITQSPISPQSFNQCSNDSLLKNYFMYNLLQDKTIIRNTPKQKGQ